MGIHLFEAVGMGMGMGMGIQDMNPHPYPPCTHTHNPRGLPIPMQGPNRKRHSLNSGLDRTNTISTEMRDHSSGHLSKSEDLLAFLCHGYYPTAHTGIDLLLKSSKIFNRALMRFRRSG